MPAVAYLRKSRVTSDRGVSWDVQEAAVRELAVRDGHQDVLILSDWSISGRKGRSQRPGYDRLLTMIETGEATAVYSYSLSRLSRTLPEFLALVDRCTDAGVPLRLEVEKHLDPTTATGRLIIRILASVAAMEAEIAQERATDAIEARRARGDRVGGIRYGKGASEDLDAVLAAFRDAGTWRGAAILLNTRGVPTRRGRPWLAPTVRAIVNRVAPELVPAGTTRGAPAAPPFQLARLLRCPYDGKMLTGQLSSEGTPRYSCVHAYAVPGHGPRYVSERKVLPWVRAEVERLRTPSRVQVIAAQDRKRADLDARRARILDMYESGAIKRDDYLRRLTTADEVLAGLELERRIVDVPHVDWTWAPQDVNRVLRAVFLHVELGPDLLPIRAEWFVPEWRAA